MSPCYFLWNTFPFASNPSCFSISKRTPLRGPFSSLYQSRHGQKSKEEEVVFFPYLITVHPLSLLCTLSCQMPFPGMEYVWEEKTKRIEVSHQKGIDCTRCNTLVAWFYLYLYKNKTLTFFTNTTATTSSSSGNNDNQII